MNILFVLGFFFLPSLVLADQADVKTLLSEGALSKFDCRFQRITEAQWYEVRRFDSPKPTLVNHRKVIYAKDAVAAVEVLVCSANMEMQENQRIVPESISCQKI
jgi:hypothetical protein